MCVWGGGGGSFAYQFQVNLTVDHDLRCLYLLMFLQIIYTTPPLLSCSNSVVGLLSSD